LLCFLELLVKAVFPHLERIFTLGMKTAKAETSTCTVVQNCGPATNAPAPGAPAICVSYLVKVLENKNVGQHTPPVALAGISAQLALLGDNTAALDPFMPTIKAYATAHGPQVDAIVDWHEGRSLKKLGARMEALEATVAALND
jgi:hypothetical protein